MSFKFILMVNGRIKYKVNLLRTNSICELKLLFIFTVLNWFKTVYYDYGSHKNKPMIIGEKKIFFYSEFINIIFHFHTNDVKSTH